MFEKATRMKLRIPTVIGPLSVEDLWQLPLTANAATSVSLDMLAKETHRMLSNAEVSFVSPKDTTKQTETLQLQMDILKHIIDTKLADRDAASKAKERKERRQKIMAAIEEAETSELRNKSVDELKKMLNEEE